MAGRPATPASRSDRQHQRDSDRPRQCRVSVHVFAAVRGLARSASGIMVSKPVDQFAFSELSFPSATVSKRIDEGQQLVQERIAESGSRNSSVQWFERDASMLPIGKRPDGRQVGAGLDVSVQRRCRVRGGHATRHSSSLRGKRVSQAMDEELLDGLEQRSVAGVSTRNETRQRETLQSGMNLGGADR